MRQDSSRWRWEGTFIKDALLLAQGPSGSSRCATGHPPPRNWAMVAVCVGGRGGGWELSRLACTPEGVGVISPGPAAARWGRLVSVRGVSWGLRSGIFFQR